MPFRLAILALGVAFAAAPALLAQHSGGGLPPPAGQSPPAQRPAATVPAQADQGAPLSQLGLSDDQKKQIHKIRQQAEEQVQAIKKDSSLSQQQKTLQIRQVRQNRSEQVDEILTPEQRQKFDAWKKSRHHRRKTQPPPPSRPGGA